MSYFSSSPLTFFLSISIFGYLTVILFHQMIFENIIKQKKNYNTYKALETKNCEYLIAASPYCIRWLLQGLNVASTPLFVYAITICLRYDKSSILFFQDVKIKTKRPCSKKGKIWYLMNSKQ